jgi:hypothetical protein
MGGTEATGRGCTLAVEMTRGEEKEPSPWRKGRVREKNSEGRKPRKVGRRRAKTTTCTGRQQSAEQGAGTHCRGEGTAVLRNTGAEAGAPDLSPRALSQGTDDPQRGPREGQEGEGRGGGIGARGRTQWGKQTAQKAPKKSVGGKGLCIWNRTDGSSGGQCIKGGGRDEASRPRGAMKAMQAMGLSGPDHGYGPGPRG